MASRQQITEALRWCNQHGLSPLEVANECASVGITENQDTGDMIVTFVRYSKERITRRDLDRSSSGE